VVIVSSIELTVLQFLNLSRYFVHVYANF